MKNIAIIITKLRGGGAERVASNLSIELEQNYNISLIVFDGQDRAYPYGGKLFDLQLPAQKTSLKRIKNMFYRIKAVKKIKEEESIDCTISLLDGPNIVNLLSKRRDKVIVSVRNLLSSENMSILRKMTIKYVGNHSDKLVALSKLVKKDLANNFGISDNKMVTIYNSCDNARLLELSQSELGNKFKLESGCRYVVTVGRLTKQKGQWHLIRAFRKVVDIIPNAKLLILGEGELFDKLKLLSDELQLSDNIIFVGFVKNPHSIIRKCDIFVFPSLFEGLGNALIEALAMGKASAYSTFLPCSSP
jgi:glycosyltransferase involved in cell wall biosynthesis